MRNKIKLILEKDKLLFVTMCLLSCVLFYCISTQIPIVLDDCGYGSAKTLKAIIAYQSSDYLHLNGRVFAHGIGQLFSGILGKGVFDVFSSFVFLGLIWLVVWHVNKESNNWFFFTLVMALLWFFYPDQYTTMGMIAGSMNYLWASAVLLLFLFLFFKCDTCSFSKLGFVLFCGYSFLAGAWSEMYAVCVGPALLLLLLMNRKRLNRQEVVSFVLFGLGAVFMVFAPGNFVRLNMVTGGERASLSTYFLNVVCEVLRSPLIWIWLITGLLVLVAKFKRYITFKDFLRENVFWLSAIVFSLLFIWISAASWPRTFFAVYTFSFIVLVKSLSLIPLKQWIQVMIVSMVWISVIFDFTHEKKVCLYNRNILDNLIQEVRNHPEKDCFSFAKMNHSRRAIGNDVLREEEKNWRVRSFCNFYGIPHVFSVIPEEVFEACNATNQHEALFRLDNYYVCQVEKRSQSIMLVWNESPCYVIHSKPKRLFAAMGFKKMGKRWYESANELFLGKLLLEKVENVSSVHHQPPDADFELFGYYLTNGRLYLYFPKELTNLYDCEVKRIVQVFD